MKRLTFIFLFMCSLSLFYTAQAQTEEKENKDYLIVIANSKDQAACQKEFDKVKSDYEDAGILYDVETDQYYVYIERYYVKSGADYAVWWHKKENKDFLKVWAKAVPPGTK